MLFERADGILIRFKDPSSKSSIHIAILELSTHRAHGWSLSTAQFERFFELNVELMNPNKIEDRCKWIAERIRIPSGDKVRNDSLLLEQDVAAKLIDVELDHCFKLPMGKMSPAERQRVHREITSSDGKRMANIETRERQRMKRATDVANSLHRERGESEIALESQIMSALDSCLHEVSEKKRSADRVAVDRRALDERREACIRTREIERVEREERWLEKMRETKAHIARSRQENIAQWRKARDQTRLRSRDEEVQFKSAMKLLEEKRQVAYDARELRWKVKSDEYLRSRAEKIKASQRKQIIIREKKQAQAFDLFSSQPIPN